MIQNILNWTAWKMAYLMAIPVGNVLMVALQMIPDLITGFTGSNNLQEIADGFLKVSKLGIVLVGIVYIGLYASQGKIDKTKMAILNVIKGYLVVLIISLPVNALQTIPTALDPQFDANASMVADLINPFIQRQTDDGKIVLSNGETVNETEVTGDNYDLAHDIITSSQGNELKTEDYESEFFTPKSRDKDLEKKGILDINAEYQIKGSDVKFHYTYTFFLLPLILFMALFVLLLFAIIKVVMKVLELMWLGITSSLSVLQSVINQDEMAKVKEYFITIGSCILAIIMQLVFFTTIPFILGVFTDITSKYGLVAIIVSWVALGVWLIDGPDKMTQLFGFDLGIQNPTSAYFMGKGMKGLGKGIKNTAQGVTKAGEYINDRINDGFSSINDGISNGSEDTAGSGAGTIDPNNDGKNDSTIDPNNDGKNDSVMDNNNNNKVSSGTIDPNDDGKSEDTIEDNSEIIGSDSANDGSDKQSLEDNEDLNKEIINPDNDGKENIADANDESEVNGSLGISDGDSDTAVNQYNDINNDDTEVEDFMEGDSKLENVENEIENDKNINESNADKVPVENEQDYKNGNFDNTGKMDNTGKIDRDEKYDKNSNEQKTKKRNPNELDNNLKNDSNKINDINNDDNGRFKDISDFKDNNQNKYTNSTEELRKKVRKNNPIRNSKTEYLLNEEESSINEG